MPVIILFIVLTFPGKPPVKHQEIVPDLNECLTQVSDYLKKAMDGGHNIQAGCVVQRPETSGT